MRVVLDTNVLVSALLFRGRLSRFVRLWKERAITPVLSRESYAEFRAVLEYPNFGLTHYEIDTLLQEEILPFFDVIEVRERATGICRDPADDAFLALARSAEADWLVTGDRDLPELGRFEETCIVTPQEFLGNYKE